MKVHHVVLAVLTMAAPARSSAQITSTSGIVVDSATGRSVAGVLVTFSGNGLGQSVVSRDDGAFRLIGVTAGTYTLTARRLGFAPREMKLSIGDTTARIVVSLVRVAALDTVIARRGTGISGEVGTFRTLVPLADADLLVVGTSTRARTDSAGRFFIPLRTPGTYVVRARSDGYEPVALSVVVARDSTPRLMLLLDTAAADRSNAHEAAWREFSDRARLRGTKSAIVSQAELANTGEIGLLEALQRVPAVANRQLRFGVLACLFVDGRPAPGPRLRQWDVEEVEAVEVYTDEDRSDVTGTLRRASRGYECQPTDVANPVTSVRDRIRWVVVWVKR